MNDSFPAASSKHAGGKIGNEGIITILGRVAKVQVGICTPGKIKVDL